jgi:F0F1-type ATP synthase assembly protein I
MSDARSASASHRRGALRGLDQSSVMGVELLTATLTWAGIGWLVDRWLGTAPWFLAIGALLGNAAGIYLVWLRGKRMDAVEEADAASNARSAAPPAPSEPPAPSVPGTEPQGGGR